MNTYTTEDTKIIKDESGNVIDIENMMQNFLMYKNNMDKLIAQAQEIYAAVPSAVSQDFIDTFNLTT